MVDEQQKRVLVQGNRQIFKPAVDPFQPAFAAKSNFPRKFTPIISMDRSYYGSDNIMFQQNNGREFGSKDRKPLEFHYSFRPDDNDPIATNQLRVQLNAPIQAVRQFAIKTKRFLFETQFKILIENYIDQYTSVVEFANKNCWVCFEPDIDTNQSNLAIQDVLDQILYTLNH